MAARDIELMERHRTRPASPARDLSDAEERLAVEIALGQRDGEGKRLRARIVACALEIMAEEGFHPEEFLED